MSGGGGGGGGGGARGGSAAVATVRLRMHGSRPSARRAAKATADSPTRPADVRADADVCTVAAVIDVSSSRTGVPRPQRRARLLRQQAAEAAREPAAGGGGGGGGGGAGDDGAGGGSSAPPAITAVPRAPSLRLGLAELSLDSVDRCLPAADGRTIAAQSGREATDAARQSDGETVRPGQQRSGDTAYIRAWLAEGRA